MCQEVGQVAKLVIVAMAGWACVQVLQTSASGFLVVVATSLVVYGLTADPRRRDRPGVSGRGDAARLAAHGRLVHRLAAARVRARVFDRSPGSAERFRFLMSEQASV